MVGNMGPASPQAPVMKASKRPVVEAPGELRIGRMGRKPATRFAVMPESEVETVAYVREQGFERAGIERDDDGFVYLLFPALSDVE